MRRYLALSLAVFAFAACADTTPVVLEAAPVRAVPPAPGVWKVTHGADELVARIVGGQPAVGPLIWEFDVPDAIELESVDLVSPTMPLHGVTRYLAEARDADGARAVIEVPMEGDWSLYLNLNDGSSERVDFVVPAAQAGPTGHGAHHH